MRVARAANLNILATPYLPSNLSIPPSPLSPRSPLTPIISKPLKREYTLASRRRTQDIRKPLSLPIPPSPLNWVWQCHICRIRYPLGVTRRCIEDGHFFCAGTSVVRTKHDEDGLKKKVVKRHKACSSEFDYQGWRLWGDWRRSEEKAGPFADETDCCDRTGVESSSSTLGLDVQEESGQLRERSQPAAGRRRAKNCWQDCNYPSECLWAPTLKKRKSSALTTPGLSPTSVPDALLDSPSASIDERRAGIDFVVPAIDFDDILHVVHDPMRTSTEQPVLTRSSKAMEAIFGVLHLKAWRRVSDGSPSPLALETIGEDTELRPGTGSIVPIISGQTGPGYDANDALSIGGTELVADDFSVF